MMFILLFCGLLCHLIHGITNPPVSDEARSHYPVDDSHYESSDAQTGRFQYSWQNNWQRTYGWASNAFGQMEKDNSDGEHMRYVHVNESFTPFALKLEEADNSKAVFTPKEISDDEPYSSSGDSSNDDNDPPPFNDKNRDECESPPFNNKFKDESDPPPFKNRDDDSEPPPFNHKNRDDESQPPLFNDKNKDDSVPPPFNDKNRDDDSEPPPFNDKNRDDDSEPYPYDKNKDDSEPPPFNDKNRDDDYEPPQFNHKNRDNDADEISDITSPAPEGIGTSKAESPDVLNPTQPSELFRDVSKLSPHEGINALKALYPNERFSDVSDTTPSPKLTAGSPDVISVLKTTLPSTRISNVQETTPSSILSEGINASQAPNESSILRPTPTSKTVSDIPDTATSSKETDVPKAVIPGWIRDRGRTTPAPAPGIRALPVPKLGLLFAPLFQWHVGIYSKSFTPYMQVCGGTLVKADVVLSAAHCFWSDEVGALRPALFGVAAGKLLRPWEVEGEMYAQRSDVKDIKIPPRFRGVKTSFQDDIAILLLSSSLEYAPGVKPACVSFNQTLDGSHLKRGYLGTIAGWGLTEPNGPPSQRLNYLKLPYVEIEECLRTAEDNFLKYITSDKICAGDRKSGRALCRGDSGGGLVYTSLSIPYIHGIASTAQRDQNECNAHAVATFTHLLAHQRFLVKHVPDIESYGCEKLYAGHEENETRGTTIKPTSAYRRTTPMPSQAKETSSTTLTLENGPSSATTEGRVLTELSQTSSEQIDRSMLVKPIEVMNEVTATPNAEIEKDAVMPSEAIKLMEVTPSVVEEELKTMPSGTKEEVKMTPSKAKEEVKTTPSAADEEVKTTPSEAKEEVKTTPSGTREEVKMTTSKAKEEVKTTPSAADEELKKTSGEATKEVLMSVDSGQRNVMKVPVENGITQFVCNCYCNKCG